MLDFRPLQLEDLPRLRPYFAYSGSRLCDTTPGTVFIWRDMYRTEYALWDNSLYFKVDYPGVGPTFTLPLGGGRLEQFRQIAEYCLQNKLPLRFVPVPKDELDRMLHFFPGSTAQADRDTCLLYTSHVHPVQRRDQRGEHDQQIQKGLRLHHRGREHPHHRPGGQRAARHPRRDPGAGAEPLICRPIRFPCPPAPAGGHFFCQKFLSKLPEKAHILNSERDGKGGGHHVVQEKIF